MSASPNPLTSAELAAWTKNPRHLLDWEAERLFATIEQLRQQLEYAELRRVEMEQTIYSHVEYKRTLDAENRELRQQLEEAQQWLEAAGNVTARLGESAENLRQRGDALAEALRPLVHLLTYDQDPRNYSTQVLGSIEAASTALDAWGKDLVTKP